MGVAKINTILRDMSIKLIIVDDAPFIREVVRHAVSASHINLIGEASNGVEAVELVLRTRPDVVLMDIVMPIKSGIAASQEILEQWPEATIIACSTLDQNLMVEKAMAAGCKYYLHKPFKVDELIQIIQTAAASPRDGHRSKETL